MNYKVIENKMPAKKTPEPVAVAPVVTPEAVGGKKPIAKKTEAKKPDDKKVEDKKVGGVQAVAVVEVVPVKEEVKEEQSGGDVILNGLLDKVGSLGAQLKAIQSSLKLLVKEFDKQKKIIDKVQKKKEKAKKSPSGFAKPCKISDELCDFMGIAKGTEQSRTDITRHINSYVKEHNLNNPQNRREFFPDKKLKAILNVKDGEKVTYFILQRLIAHHFPPSLSKLAAANKAAA
jgi:chromatin remodeling complex protein RSC6